MGKRLLLITLIIPAFLMSEASVITLRNGKTMRGDVLVQNEEVVIVKDEKGARFQYPANEVISISEEENNVQEPEETADHKHHSRKTTIMLGLTGGGAIIPQEKGGGHIAGEFMIGSRHIGQRTVFVGGGLGVHGILMSGRNHLFLPLQVAVNVPFIEGKHAPFAGAAIGYGFGLSKGTTGGIYTSAQVGYRYALNNKSALLLSLRAQFQQAKIEATEIISAEDGTETAFTNVAGRSFVTIGLHLGFTF